MSIYSAADFYPNGGKYQPGCPKRNRLANLIGETMHLFYMIMHRWGFIFSIFLRQLNSIKKNTVRASYIHAYIILLILFVSEKCNHARVHDLFLESLFMKFEAIQCVSYEEIQKNHCTFFNATSIMGGEITKRTLKPHGIFYLETNSQSPYNIPDYKNFKNIQLVIYKWGLRSAHATVYL